MSTKLIWIDRNNNLTRFDGHVEARLGLLFLPLKLFLLRKQTVVFGMLENVVPMGADFWRLIFLLSIGCRARAEF